MPVAGLPRTGGRRTAKGVARWFPAGSRHLLGWAAQPLRAGPAWRSRNVVASEGWSALQRESAPALGQPRWRGGARGRTRVRSASPPSTWKRWGGEVERRGIGQRLRKSETVREVGDPEHARGGGTRADLARFAAAIYTCGEPASFPWRDSVLLVCSEEQ
ncbi:hypothetical protein NN561_020270 [Cricetulus griseus]